MINNVEKSWFSMIFLFVSMTIILLALILLSISMVSATYSSFQTQYHRADPFSGVTGVSGLTTQASFEDFCEEGQDFVLQIAPASCTPPVVRSDLLEENNVPVFCPIMATKINPLIDVNAIDHISFSGDYAQGVSGVGFYPAHAAIDQGSTQTNYFITDNIGYAVIVLKQNPVEDDMPDWVEGTVTAHIRYDAENAFGIGESSFSVPVLSDEEWEENYRTYGFWNGKAYIRAEAVDTNSARLAIYRDKEHKQATFTLQKDQTSNSVYMPGFFCLAGLKVKLKDLVNPSVTARIRIEGEIHEVSRGERFLDNRCQVINVLKNGLNQEISFRCSTDDMGSQSYTLVIKPRISVSIGENNFDVGSGEKIGETNIYFIKSRQENAQTFYYFLKASSNFGNELSSRQMSELNRGIETENYDSDFGEIFKVLDSKSVFDITLSIQGDAIPQNIEMSQEFENYFTGALNNYETLREQFSAENATGSNGNFLPESFAEKGLYEAILMARATGQKETMVELINEFKELYPGSSYFSVVENLLNDESMSSVSIASQTVIINNQPIMISLESVREPSFEEYGARIMVDNVEWNLRADEVIRPFDNENEYIELEELGNDYAVFDIGTINDDNSRRRTTRKRISLGGQEAVDSYTIRLLDINLEKIAKVEILPELENAGTSANFSFRIGIEKRAIDLSPEKIKDRIKNLNEKIERWEDISSKLGKFVKGMKAACLSVGTYLTVKNLFANLNGKAIARQSVMQGDGGWNQWCQNLVESGNSNYDDVEACLLDKGKEIEQDVNARYSALQIVNNQLKRIDNDNVDSTRFGERVIDHESVRREYIPEVADALLSSGIEHELGNTKPEIEANLENSRLETLRDIHVDILSLQEEYSSRGKNEPNTNDAIQNRLNRRLESLQRVSASNAEIRELTGAQFSGVGVMDYIPDQTLEGVYSGGVLNNGWNGIDRGTPVAIIRYNPQDTDNSQEQDFNVYVLELGAVVNPSGRINYRVEGIYSNSGASLLGRSKDGEWGDIAQIGQPHRDEIDSLRELTFNAVSSESCEGNRFVGTPVVRYNGRRPAIVPFDLENGWYAATQSFDDSDLIRSFYICNVGANGIEEFNSRGRDICQQINLFTGQAEQTISCVDSVEESRELIEKAQLAIEDASRGYEPGVDYVHIRGNRIKVGEQVSDMSGTRCTDFMSPKDCKLLFNVCDPVICPASRCDLGGSYPVDDVIQSGIIGSIALCLPNFNEGILIPVCLTGIQAGVDSFVSIMTSYRDCLEENLESGKTIGICDEIHSIYLCEFFWRQAVPFTKLIIPTILKMATGQNLHGGGEYLGVASAWKNTEQSINYFTQYYGANSYAAFKARTTDEAGTEFCRMFISARYPVSGDFFDALIEPDSPSQIYGRFDEIPFTTATEGATSHYKVYYHIYAGKDVGVTYNVYLRSPESMSLYQINPTRAVARGHIAKGDYASETVDFIASSGYQELCISVNAKEYCGFQQVTTSFAINYAGDLYETEQAQRTDITSEEECVSGSSSLFTMLNPNLQEGVDETISPELYSHGIIRVCATDNPGQSTDINWNNPDEARWLNVGYCGNPEMRCWLDTNSVREVIHDSDLESQALETAAQQTLDALMASENYFSELEFREFVKENLEGLISNRGLEPEIAEGKSMSDLINGLELIDLNYGKALMTSHKAELIWFRARIFNALAREIHRTWAKEHEAEPSLSVDVDEEEDDGGEDVEVNGELSCEDYDESRCLGDSSCEWSDGFFGIGRRCEPREETIDWWIIHISESDLDRGYIVEIGFFDILIFEYNGEKHQIYFIEVDGNDYYLVGASDPVYFKVNKNEKSKKINLDNDNDYDVVIVFLGYSNNKIKLNVRKLVEGTPVLAGQEKVSGGHLENYEPSLNRIKQLNDAKDQLNLPPIDWGFESSTSVTGEYPVHRLIKASVFWIGESGNYHGAYDSQLFSGEAWENIYGGKDVPNPRKQNNLNCPYFSAGENPFYVALPCNVMIYNQEGGDIQGISPGQWVKITYNNRNAYAKFYDVGPWEVDDCYYVFNEEDMGNRPLAEILEASGTTNGAGIDLSPAVFYYLTQEDIATFTPHNLESVSWQFVTESEVPNGPWTNWRNLCS